VTMSTAYGANAAASTPEKESTEAEDAREGMLRPTSAADNHNKSSQVNLPVFPGL